jgi:hypothetical protein
MMLNSRGHWFDLVRRLSAYWKQPRKEDAEDMRAY